MKKKLTYILLLISLAATLVSCREIEISVAASGDPIHVRVMVTEGPGTRGVATGTSLPTEATMYLSADHNGTGASGNYFSNVPFTASGSTWSPQSGSYYWPLSGNLELLGFCNYGPTDFSSSATRTNATAISVSSSDWTNNDMMFGAATGAPASGTTMAFRHALAQVKFTARMTVDGSINLKSITFNGIKGATLSCSKSSGSASLTVNSSTSGYSSSTVTAFSGTQALTSTATAAGSPVLMPDQTITSITVTYASVSGGVEGTAETVTKPVSQALTKGYAYTFALTVESQDIRFDISVTPWNTNPINIGEFPTTDAVDEYLTFEAIENGQMVWYTNYTGYGNLIYYSINGGEWSGINPSKIGTSVSVSAGDKVRLKGYNHQYANGLSSGYVNYLNGTAAHYIYGDMSSMLADDYKEDYSSAVRTFFRFFQNDVNLVSHPTKKILLPCVNLNEGCYGYLFYGCTGITTCPIYELPATTLTKSCYSAMFQGCSSLVETPELPATSLAISCYTNMFYGCTSLTTAPELPATNINYQYCYYGMFRYCSSLNYIKAAFTSLPTNNSQTTYWVDGVSSTGTFVKNSAAGWNITGTDAVPSGWTVETYTP